MNECHTKSVHADAKKVGLQTTQIPKNLSNTPWKLYCMPQLQEKDCDMRTEFKYVFLLVGWVTKAENIVWSEQTVFHTGGFNLPQMPFWTKKQSIQEFSKGSQSCKGLVWKDIHNGWSAYHLSHRRQCEIPWRLKMTQCCQSSGKTLKFFNLCKMGQPFTLPLMYMRGCTNISWHVG